MTAARKTRPRDPHAGRSSPGRTHLAVRVGELCLWGLVLLPPVVVVPVALDSFRLPKLVVSSWLALGSLLCFAWLLRRVPRIGLRELVAVPALRVAAPVLLVATAGLAATSYPRHTVAALISLWVGAACLVGWSLALPPARLRRFLDGLTVPAVVLALLGIAQFHGLRFFSFVAGEELERLGLTSLAGNPGDFSAYLLLPCLIAQHALGTRRRRRGTWAAALVVMLYALAASQTLTTMAALAVSSLLLWWRILPRKRALVAAAAAAGLLAVGVMGLTPLRERVMKKVKEIEQGDVNLLLTGRLDGWRVAAFQFSQHPWIGVGHGAYRPEFARAKLALVGRGVEFLRNQPNPTFANAHNEYLEVAAEWGVPGLLALGWALWVVGRSARRLEREDGRETGALAWAGLAGLGLLALASFPFRLALTAFPALLFLAWLLRPGPLPGAEA